jgi:hypothetical protein
MELSLTRPGKVVKNDSDGAIIGWKRVSLGDPGSLGTSHSRTV